uniref:Uncharacterized protein n=1 Tax=Arundo donax TaxID=35708 RepID=A0A0A9FZS4_ARUDO
MSADKENKIMSGSPKKDCAQFTASSTLNCPKILQ